MNFLTLCLLGKTDMVKTMLTAFPELLHMKGPHGFTPLHHAIKVVRTPWRSKPTSRNWGQCPEGGTNFPKGIDLNLLNQ